MGELVFVALGSNLGCRTALLGAARNALSLLRTTWLVAASAVEETAPFGSGAQGPYLNQMVALRSCLTPYSMLAELQRIERTLGRVHGARWTARTIDLDIVRHGSRQVADVALTIPHPGLSSRAFWRRELAMLEAITA